jgi:peptide-methionine (S)-S-oxide reductase
MHPFPDPALDVPATSAPQSAVLAGGCFWCVEAVYRQLDGVLECVSGYAGGTAETANYKAVCGGATDHAEAVRIRFDPGRLTFGRLLKVFFSVAHDPTQLNRQGADVGRQYRSAIFPADDRQKHVAEAYIKQLNDANVFGRPVVTQVAAPTEFHAAEDYHQDFAALHPNQGYIACVALPKVEKVRALYPEMLKRR